MITKKTLKQGTTEKSTEYNYENNKTSLATNYTNSSPANAFVHKNTKTS